MNGLQNITSIGHAIPNTTEYKHWRSTVIRNIPNLTSLNELGGLNKVYHGMTIENNINLTDYCGLDDLFSNNGFTGDYSVTGNAYNPTEVQLYFGHCSY